MGGKQVSQPFIKEIWEYFERRLKTISDRNVTIKVLEPTHAVFHVPYHPGYAGDPRSGALYGGFITALLDTAFGMAILARLGEPMGIATVDLRVDYLTPSRKDTDLIVRTECYKLGKTLAFARGTAFHDGPHIEIAAGTASFMLDSRESSQLPKLEQ